MNNKTKVALITGAGQGIVTSEHGAASQDGGVREVTSAGEVIELPSKKNAAFG